MKKLILNITLPLILFFSLQKVYSDGSGTPCAPTGGDNGGDHGGGDSIPGGSNDWKFISVVSDDPNEIKSPAGFDSARWVSVNDAMGYTINFENDPTRATAPAHRVYVYYPVSEKQNIQSFRVSSFGFNGMVFPVPSNVSHYATRLDLRDSLDLYVDVFMGIDVIDNRAFWIFESIDPLTGLPPTNPLNGFLPVGDTAEVSSLTGHGFVGFTMKPKTTDITRDTIFATAQIVFDTNDTIPTNTEFNTVDALPPASGISASAVANNTVTLTITANDDNNGSGVKNYDLYVAKDSGAYYAYSVLDTSFIKNFTGVAGSTYHFFSLATDHTGNREGMKYVPDVSVTMVAGASPWYADADGDLFGNAAVDSVSVLQPDGYIADNTDCNDADPLEYPGQTWFADMDNDGYSDGTMLVQCARPAGYKIAGELTQTSGDCNDTNAGVHPGATEVCNSIDDNCNGQVDEGLAPALPGTITGPSQAVCKNTTKSYSVAAQAGVTFNWLPPANATILSGQGSNAVSVRFNSMFVSGTLSVTAANACATSAASQLAIASTAPIPASITGPTSVCRKSTQTYSCPAVAGASSYNWRGPGGSTILSGQGTTTISLKFGNSSGNVQVRTSNACGYSAYRLLAVTVNNCIREADEENIAGMLLYPNPANQNVSLLFNSLYESNYEIRLTDMLGKTITVKTGTTAAGDNEITISVATLTKGVYQLEFVSENGNAVKKLVVN